MKHFISVELVVLVMFSMIIWTIGPGTIEAAPLDKTDATAREQSVAEIGQTSHDYLDALQHGDGEAIAEFWTADGIFVDITGRSVSARGLAIPVVFTTQEQAARQQILDSVHWKETRKQFKQWLSVQTAYDSAQLAQQEVEIKQHIATLQALELKKFLEAMYERLTVLLSPEMNQARSWVDHYYTEKAQRRMAKKLNVEQPMKMTGSELNAALKRFQEQRSVAAQSSAAFNRSRQSSNKSIKSYRDKQQAAAAKS